MGVTKFADLTKEEFKNIYLTTEPIEINESLGVFE